MFLALSSAFTNLPLFRSFLLISCKNWKRYVDLETQKNWLKWTIKLLQQRNIMKDLSFPRNCWTEISWQISYQMTGDGEAKLLSVIILQLDFPNLQNLFTRQYFDKASTSRTIWAGIFSPFEYDTSDAFCDARHCWNCWTEINWQISTK